MIKAVDIMSLAAKLNSLGAEYLFVGKTAAMVRREETEVMTLDVSVLNNKRSVDALFASLLSSGWFPNLSQENLQLLLTHTDYNHGQVAFSGLVHVNMNTNNISELLGEVVDYEGVPVRIIK